ncbi:hypothetical protein QM797_17140 [Rhodococcus sp. IEGM 1381]|uniref:hypothetical protein n=1 Tax=Rhodococcus sp. IEGM 1381 TaxID=3047085 RepID=UPI0024B78E7C|nr:hypothetical protein [Rhodococcus sp. IEGM 1381]MDI9896454.1 hypothetical protein [Rhodococcus sp. IEGM 1381]
MDESFVVSADSFKYWHVDYQTGTLRIVYQSGEVHDAELDTEYRPTNSPVATSTFDWEKWWILSTTTRNDLIITEGFNPTSPPALKGRPSVYLDQNRWRTVADAMNDPLRVENIDERHAAEELIFLACDAGIVLPLSTGHLLETAGLQGELRYEIGLAMARLAGGWQIRHPLDLWKHEVDRSIRLHLGLTKDSPVLHPIVTEPGALFGRDTSLSITDETPNIDKFMAMLTMPSVILSQLIDPKTIEKDPVTNWVRHHETITAQIRATRLPKEQRRQLARRRYWNENIGFYTTAYRRLTKSNDFPTFSDTDLTRMFADSPMVGLVSELFVRRFIDHRNKWRRNDLVDMFHLSSAAGYADYVCAETHTGTQLREAQRTLGRPENVFTTLSQLVTALRADGVQADSERATSN